MSDSPARPDGMTRRDFLDGFAVAIGAGLLSTGCERPGPEPPGAEQGPSYYPPALQGMRGSHPGAFETAHQMRDGKLGRIDPHDTGERYDLIVVGGGISGLTAAHLYQKARGDKARVLILENHDDIGGHARRNEFTVDGQALVTYGGTESIESPAQYSDIAREVLADIGVDTERFYTAFDQKQADRLGLGPAVFFDALTFGDDRLVPGDVEELDRRSIARMPLSAAGRRDLVTIYHGRKNYFPKNSSAEVKALLAKMSYRDYLAKIVGAGDEALRFLQVRSHDLYGVGIDAIPALDAWGLEYAGFGGLKLDEEAAPGMGRTPLLERNEEEPYIFHFPDGNASVARLLLRRLHPSALPGSSMDDVVTAKLAYATLDDPSASTRVRLNATVVRARHVGEPAAAKEVEVVWVRNGGTWSARANHCVLACWNMVIPYLCPELPANQKAALAYGAKVPLVYTSVALRNWKAFQKLGVLEVYAPGSYFFHVFLEYPVTLGDYHASESPERPIVVHLVRTPCKPGVPARDQQRAGRQELLDTPFATFEAKAKEQLTRMLGAGGFDATRDIAGITVNRWAHGYTYEYNSLWDPVLPEAEQPCAIGRQRFGRIAIANADAGAFAYTNGAIDQAARAVSELMAPG